MAGYIVRADGSIILRSRGYVPEHQGFMALQGLLMFLPTGDLLDIDYEKNK